VACASPHRIRRCVVVKRSHLKELFFRNFEHQRPLEKRREMAHVGVYVKCECENVCGWVCGWVCGLVV
jgi:predicted RNA-binding protein YlxR (DUF448 family)